MSDALSKLAEQMKAAQASGKTPPAPVETVQPVVEKKVEAQQTQPAAATPATPTLTGKDLLLLVQEVQRLREKEARGDLSGAQEIVRTKPPIDWTKISEKDITNLDLEIPVIEQEKPSYMEIHLSDANYVARWVHKMPARLGICLSEGYSHVRAEDWNTNFPRPLQFDESGHYSHGDVIGLKILKSRYYPALKANYLKTMAIHGKKTLASAIARGKSGVQLNRQGEEIIGGIEPEQIDPSRVQFFDPGDKEAKGEKEYTREMVGL
jgi:hypothetical protein